MTQINLLCRLSRKNCCFFFCLCLLVFLTVLISVRKYVKGVEVSYRSDDENEKEDQKEANRPWRSRSLLFKFADIAARTTSRPVHTLPLKYLQEKIKEIREKGVMSIGGEDDPLVAYRRLIMTIRKWQETRKAWQYLPRMNTLLFHKPKPHTEEEYTPWNSSAPLPSWEMDRIKGHEHFLNKAAEWNKYHTQSSMIYVSTDSVHEYGSFTLEPGYYHEMYRERFYDGSIMNKSDVKLYRISREDEYSSETSSEQYFSIDSYGFMDLLYYNLTRHEKQDLGFQLLRAALNYSRVDAPERVDNLNRQHFDLLVAELNKHVPFKRREDSIELAFQMLKRKLITRKVTKPPKRTLTTREPPSVELNDVDINEFLQKNFAMLQNKIPGVINYDPDKQNGPVVRPQNELVFNTPKGGHVYGGNIESSTRFPLVDQTNVVERTVLKNIQTLDHLKKIVPPVTRSQYAQGFPVGYTAEHLNYASIRKRNKVESSRRENFRGPLESGTRSQRLYKDGKIPFRDSVNDRKIRPYTRRKFTFRQNRTYGFARTLSVFRSYIATYFSRRRHKSYKISKRPFSRMKTLRGGLKPTAFEFRNSGKSQTTKYNTKLLSKDLPHVLNGMKNHKSKYFSNHESSSFHTKTARFHFLQRPKHERNGVGKINATRTWTTKNKFNNYKLHVNTYNSFNQAILSHQNTRIPRFSIKSLVTSKSRMRTYTAQNSNFRNSPTLSSLSTSKYKKMKKRSKSEIRVEALKTVLI